MAWGTNMGIGQMAETSDIDYHTLADASDNFLRPETLEAANDLVCNATYERLFLANTTWVRRLTPVRDTCKNAHISLKRM